MDKSYLQKENELLKKKLLVAEFWMQREVSNYIDKISKEKLSTFSAKQKQTFFSENINEIVENSIYNFFGELMILSTPQEVIENIISGEILFYNININKQVDWLWIVSSYHKSVDLIIEEQITKPFRKYFNDKKIIIKLENNPLEKSLNSILIKWYIFSLWRLFSLLKSIKNNDELWQIWKIFSDFLDSNIDIKNILLDDDFLSLFSELMESWVLSDKRHKWKIDFSDVKKTRKIMIWNFEEKNCFLYKLLKIWAPDF